MPTEVDRLRSIGFNASLSKRGVSVTLQATDNREEMTFNALVEPYAPTPEQYNPNQETREQNRIHILTDALTAQGATDIENGDVFHEGSKSHRVTLVRREGIKTIFTCESSDLTPEAEEPQGD